MSLGRFLLVSSPRRQAINAPTQPDGSRFLPITSPLHHPSMTHRDITALALSRENQIKNESSVMMRANLPRITQIQLRQSGMDDQIRASSRL